MPYLHGGAGGSVAYASALCLQKLKPFHALQAAQSAGVVMVGGFDQAASHSSCLFHPEPLVSRGCCLIYILVILNSG